MQRTQMWRILWGMCLVGLLLLSSAALAASPHQEDPFPPDGDGGPVPPLETPAVPGPAEGEPGDMGPASVQAIRAAPSPMMNYQGLLTDVDGSPLSGPYTMVFSLHTAASGGAKVWGDETHPDVVVSNGLFQVVLGSIVPLTADLFADQLYLQTTVGATVLPRQMLLAAPYAMGLTIGSGVSGATAGEGQYGFSVSNGGGRGIYANAVGDGSIAIYSADRIYSGEGYSGPDTVVWVPGNNLEVYTADTAQGHIDQYGAGLVRVNMDADNETVQVTLPVQLERLYGRAFRLTHVTLYYKVGAPSYIDEVQVEGRNYNTNAVIEQVVTANGSSATYAKYDMTVDPPIEINNEQAISNIWLVLKTGTPGGAGGFVDVYAARLTLQSSY